MSIHIDVAILDANQYFALGLEEILKQHFFHKQWSVAFLPAAHSEKADLLFLGSSINGIARYSRHQIPPFRQKVITVLETMQPGSRCQSATICLGEQGIITRNIKTKELLSRVDRILTDVPLPHEIDCPHCTSPLTYRECEILSAIRRCMTPIQVAKRFNCSIKTVSAHKRNAMIKLNINSDTALYYWLRNGVFDEVIRNIVRLTANRQTH